MRKGLTLIALFCLCVLLMVPAASGRLVIDLPFLPRQHLPVDIPFLENITIGTSTLPHDDDWHDGSGISYGDIVVEKGRVLSLKNYSLLLNCAYDGQYRIQVRDGGVLIVDNSSISSPGGAFLFEVRDGGKLIMKNSSLSGCGYAGPDAHSYGLWLDSAGNSLTGNNISHNHYGVIVDGGQSDIVNNTITHNDNGLLIGPAVAVVENNTICFNRMGINASAAGPGEIRGNNISYNAVYGLFLGGNSPKKASGNEISRNGEGLIVRNTTNCVVSECRLDNNTGCGLILENASVVVVRNTSLRSNALGLYVNGTSQGSLTGNTAVFNTLDGFFINNSRNIAVIANNASHNGGYGFHVPADNTNVVVDRKRNVASGNFLGDFEVAPTVLSITEVSLLSLLIAFVDKLIFLVDFQKVLLTNVFSGIVNPLRDPLSKRLDRLSHRLGDAFHIRSKGYTRAHISSHMDVLFFHIIDGKDIRGIVRSPVPGRLRSHEIVLQQVRFFDLLFRDRVLLLRNIMYLAIMTGAGIVVYTAQVWAGTYDLPYFLPLALQFLVMFPIGLAVQGNVVGHVEKLGSDLPDEASADLIRRDILARTAALEERHARKAIPEKNYAADMAVLSDALRAIEYLDVRRHYLLFTREGLTESAARFGALLEKSPGEPLFLSGFAEAHAMLGRALDPKDKSHCEMALAAARKAASIDGGRFEVRRALAMALLFNGEAEKAAPELAEALRLNPSDGEAYWLKAAMAEDPEERRRLYDKAISLNKYLRALGPEAQRVPVPASIKT